MIPTKDMQAEFQHEGMSVLIAPSVAIWAKVAFMEDDPGGLNFESKT